jgi:hypothetical protein
MGGASVKRADFAPALARVGLRVDHLKPSGRLTAQARRVVIREGIAAGLRSSEIAEILGVTSAAVRIAAAVHGLGSWGSAGRPRARLLEIRTVRRVSFLVADERPGLMPRRRRHCANLFACEDGWIRDNLAANGSTGGQARCPPGCAAYAPRLGGPAEPPEALGELLRARVGKVAPLLPAKTETKKKVRRLA